MQTWSLPHGSPYGDGLGRDAANHQALAPVRFLERAALVYPDHPALIYGALRRSYLELWTRCRRLASALVAKGVQPGDTVAILAPNIPAMLEAHHGVPMAGAVLNALNTRLDPGSIAFMLRHGRARLLLADAEYGAFVAAALARLDSPPPVVVIADPDGPAAPAFAELEYEAFLAAGDPAFLPLWPADEWLPLALDYTSGTTGDPKGVVYHHRGAWLNAIANVQVWSMPMHPTYLWTLPMFHCNGWCFPWGLNLQAGTHICLRRVDAASVHAAIRDHGVDHLCGAPIVMGMLADPPPGVVPAALRGVRMMTAASAPPAAVLQRLGGLGVEVTHVYGLTEVYGPATVCAPQPAWAALPATLRADRLARQGVRYPALDGLEVMDPETMRPVPPDGVSQGEIMMRGNIVMAGYLGDRPATERAFAEGWFHTGDLAVVHADGYLQIRDRSKDIIITGGENVSSIEVEGALYRHPAVLEAAVVAAPDQRWGETPFAFVDLRPGHDANAPALMAHCRGLLAGFKVPRRFEFGPLPKSSTGKVQKRELRERAAVLVASADAGGRG